MQNANFHSSFAIPKKQYEQFLDSPCQINHCPIRSAQNNLIFQSNHNYLLPMKTKLSKNSIKSLCLEQFKWGLSC